MRLGALGHGWLLRSYTSMAPSRSSRRLLSTAGAIDPHLLAEAWSENNASNITAALARTIPLLQEHASVPFVCRYRSDIIAPLTVRQVHDLSERLRTHAALASWRDKLLHVVDDETLRRRIQTSTEKSELEDWYAPYKPPSKGSLLERIQKEHPGLVERVDRLWQGQPVNLVKSQPREHVITLLGAKIASLPSVVDKVGEELHKHCRLVVQAVNPDDRTYKNYHQFNQLLRQVRDHQVLAIRRGVDEKALQMSYDIDGDKIKQSMLYQLRLSVPKTVLRDGDLLQQAVADAWSRLLRRRCTSHFWSSACQTAERRAAEVFCHNLSRALLAPPLSPPLPVLALDPGFAAGIKTAILDEQGGVVGLETIDFLGKKREAALKQLRQVVTKTADLTASNCPVLVALGNGHGSQECRTLIEEVSRSSSIDVDVRLVNEAGASVWSVTESAAAEFPQEPAAAIAAVSIGRRLQNPLHELVKIPPRSLGLGMYQHVCRKRTWTTNSIGHRWMPWPKSVSM